MVATYQNVTVFDVSIGVCCAHVGFKKILTSSISVPLTFQLNPSPLAAFLRVVRLSQPGLRPGVGRGLGNGLREICFSGTSNFFLIF